MSKPTFQKILNDFGINFWPFSRSARKWCRGHTKLFIGCLLAHREGLLRVFQVFWAVFSHFSAAWSPNIDIYISDLEMSGFSNQWKVMKKTVRVPMLSRGPVFRLFLTFFSIVKSKIRLGFRLAKSKITLGLDLPSNEIRLGFRLAQYWNWLGVRSGVTISTKRFCIFLNVKICPFGYV